MAAARNLIGITAWSVAFGLAWMAYRTAQAIVGGLDFNIPVINVRPLHGLAVSLENSIVEWFDDAVKASEAGVAKSFDGLKASLELFVGLAILLGYSVYKAFAYLWGTALPAFVSLQTAWIATLARKAETIATGGASTIAHNLAVAKTYAETQAERALSSAQAFTEAKLSDAVSAIRSEIGADIQAVQDGASAAATTALQIAQSGIAAAENAGRVAVADLRGEVGGELAAIQAGAAAGVTEAERLAQAGVIEAERLAGSALAQSEAAAKQLLAEAEARGKAALTEVGKIAGSIGDDLATVEGALGAAGVAGLIASIPAIATLVHAIATEAGLDSSACRAKNKQICGTNTNLWNDLLAGLVVTEVALNWKSMAHVVADGAHLFVEAAKTISTA